MGIDTKKRDKEALILEIYKVKDYKVFANQLMDKTG